ncbi:MAG: SRPBCC domain-containing protein [Caulobacter sp.]|nr:SRPBCC domain-containing protein [Caulobacter sp.]
MSDRVLIDLTISAPVEEVWAALRDPRKIARWFGWESDSLQGEVDFIFIEHATADEATGVLTFGGFGGVQDRFELTAEGTGSRLRVMRSGPADKTSWDDVYEDMTEGWIMFVQQLKFALEKEGLAPRRTLWLSLPKGERDGQRPLAALGLADLTAGHLGDAVSRALPTGDTVSGNLWHVSKYQVSVTVDAWAGLLNVHDAGGWTEGGGHGPGMVMITAYGLDDAAFADLEARWKAWWQKTYPA